MMHTVVKSHRSGRDVVPKKFVDEICGVLQDADIGLRKYAIKDFRTYIPVKLKELGWSDNIYLDRTSKISIAILPLCDERDIEELEKRLQIQNPMRAEYHWHAIALMAKEDIQNGKRDGDVAKSYGKSTQALHLLMDARDYAEQLLQI